MRRLFVAYRPPAGIIQHLLTTMGGVAGAHWQTEEQLHLTLRFIGEVDRHVAADVAAALATVHHPRFEIALDGIGLNITGTYLLWLLLIDVLTVALAYLLFPYLWRD